MTDLDRFWTLVDQTGGPDACWPWIGSARNEKGYGGFRAGGRWVVAHRWLLGALRGRPLQWPAEVACHHCDNPPCCNPAHLYVGTHSQNTVDAIDRSGHPAAARKAQTHCKRGHEFTPENTHYFGPTKSSRYCRTCKRIDSNEGHKRKRRDRGLRQRVRGVDGRFTWVAAC